MQRFTDSKGFSVTSIKYFCKRNCLSLRLPEEYLEEIVSEAIRSYNCIRSYQKLVLLDLSISYLYM